MGLKSRLYFRNFLRALRLLEQSRLPVVEGYIDMQCSETHLSVGCYRLFCTSRHPKYVRMFICSETIPSAATVKQLCLMLS